MGSIISFFKWLWNAIVSFVTWLVGVPALIISAVIGLWQSLSSLFHSLVDGSSIASNAVAVINQQTSGFSDAFAAAPDVVRLAMYALSLDHLFTYIFSVASMFLVLVVAVLTFFIVSVPAFFVQLYIVKMGAWVICSIIPKGFVIPGVEDLAKLNIATPVREALRDGKYNPWLGG